MVCDASMSHKRVCPARRVAKLDTVSVWGEGGNYTKLPGWRHRQSMGHVGLCCCRRRVDGCTPRNRVALVDRTLLSALWWHSLGAPRSEWRSRVVATCAKDIHRRPSERPRRALALPTATTRGAHPLAGNVSQQLPAVRGTKGSGCLPLRLASGAVPLPRATKLYRCGRDLYAGECARARARWPER